MYPSIYLNLFNMYLSIYLGAGVTFAPTSAAFLLNKSFKNFEV